VKPSGPVPVKTWGICLLLFFATSLIYLDRQVMALTADKIITDFGLSKQAFGHVLGSFRYAYGIFQIGSGFLVDSLGPGIMFPISGAIWSIGGLLTGFATTVSMLTGVRFMLGAGEALNWPCALKITNALLRPEDRILANGVFNSGTAVGALVAPLLVNLIAIRYSWRAAFVVTGIFASLWLASWLWFTRGSFSKLGGRPFVAAAVFSALRRILLMPRFWLLLVSAIVINSVYYYFSDWIPLYLKTSRGFTFSTGNTLSIVIYAGISVGNILTGFAVRVLLARGVSLPSAKRWALFLSCILMSFAIPAGVAANRYASVAFLGLTEIGVAGFLVVYLTVVQDLDPANIGMVSGLLGGFGNLAYGLINPYIGLLADQHRTVQVLTLAGVLPWLAFATLFFGIAQRGDT
jgi:MFS transporter, ACS family, hexuronate transporter